MKLFKKNPPAPRIEWTAGRDAAWNLSYSGHVGTQRFNLWYSFPDYAWCLDRYTGQKEHMSSWSPTRLGTAPGLNSGHIELKALAEKHVLPEVLTVAQCDHTGIEIPCLKIDGKLYSKQGEPLPDNWIEQPVGSWGVLLIVLAAFILTVGVGYALSLSRTPTL